MDVLSYVQSARRFSVALGSFALASSLVAQLVAEAELVFASDAEETSTVFIAEDGPSEPPAAPASVEGSVVFVDDAPIVAEFPAGPKATAAFVAPTAQAIPPVVVGDLKVVNQQPVATTAPLAMRPTPKQHSLVPLAKLPEVEQPAVQTASAVEPVAAPPERDQPGDIQVAIHDEPFLGPIETPRQVATSPQAQLIGAYQLSLTAKTSSEYTEIAIACGESLRHELQGDQRAFARKLASWALNRRGQIRAENDDPELANADFLTALDYNPRNWRALHNRGVSYAQGGAFAEAFDDFNAVIQINPQYAKAYANRATLYVQAKDLDAAINDYRRAIQHDEQFATAYVGLGRVCHMLGRWEDALEQFSAAIEIDPTNPDIICSRGDLQADMGNYGEALADYARTIEIAPEFGHAYRNGAWLLATCPDERFRDPSNAVLGAQQALEYSYGERHVALDTLAAAQAANGQFEEAISTVTEAVDLAPEETKFTYLSRLQLYQTNQPFRTEPVGDVSQVMYEATDQ
ncbi:MAG: tetratricopeptide repeat protein [Planctomycetota bacterium]